MAIQDSDPDRRNLLITSILFIIYFFGGGSFSNSIVRLQVINAEFTRPIVLAAIAWIILLWFLYRYWLSHKGLFFSEFATDFQNWTNQGYIKEYAKKRVAKMHPEEEIAGVQLKEMEWQGWTISLAYSHSTINRGDDGEVESGVLRMGREYMKMTGFKGWVLGLRATLECIMKNPSFSEHLAPYILAFLAICGGIVSYVF